MDKAATPSKPDHAGAIAHALRRLHAELPPLFSYHDVRHTEHDVLPAVRRLAGLAKLPEADIRLLEVAAAFHDLGHVRSPVEHEQIGIGVIAEVLPRFGFGSGDIARVSGMIRATRLPQSPRNDEEALLVDADLDSLGRDDFLATSQALWRERAALGQVIPWPTWLENQLQFLRQHRYFTAVARALRDDGKQRNIERLERMIRDGRGPAGAGEPGA